MGTDLQSYNIYKKEFELRGVWTEERAEELFSKILENKEVADTFALSFDTSDQTIMKELTKGFSVILTHLLENKRDSMWLDLVDSIEQAYDIVRFYDYSIARHKAPLLQVRYQGVETIILHRGDVVGTYEGYDIVCTEELMYLEYNDLKTFSVGKMKTLDVDVQEDSVGDYKITLIPSELKSIDNNSLWVYGVNGEEVQTTKFITKYVEELAVRDFSLDNTITEIFLRNEDKGFGVAGVFDDIDKKCHVVVLETNGILSDDNSFELNEGDVEWIDSRFSGKIASTHLSYKGFNGDTLEALKAHAPLVSTTGGYAHSLTDYQVLTKDIPELYDTNAYKDNGRGVGKTLDIINSGLEASFKLEGYTYTIEVGELEALKNNVEQNTTEYEVTILSDVTFSIQGLNYLKLTEITEKVNVEEVLVIEAVKPPCCSVLVPYIKQNYYLGNDQAKQLSSDEKISVTNITEDFKGFSAEVLYYPATETVLAFDIYLTKDSKVLDVATLNESVQNIISKYNYKVANNIIIPELVAKISQVIYEDSNQDTFPGVTSCKVDTEIKDKVYRPSVDEYYKLDVNIKYITW